MNYIKYLVLALIITAPINLIAQPPLTQSMVVLTTNWESDDEAYAYYDLRDRKSYIQITRSDTSSENPLCIHVQVFQQDQGCTELDFEDELTHNDTVIYDMDNIIRNNGSEVPINLNDDSYGIVAISTYDCDDRTSDPGNILGNFRIIDDTGYEYRVNLFTDDNNPILQDPFPFGDADEEPHGQIIIPFNTIDGATHADVIAFITEDDREINGSDDGDPDDVIYNEEIGITFDVFQLDENEERLSCDRKTFGCGPGVVLNYGINEDYPNSKGGPLLCEGAGLLPGQQHGYISLENPTFLSPIDENVSPPDPSTFEFTCMVGLNNGDNTGSMDNCLLRCDDETDPDCDDFSFF